MTDLQKIVDDLSGLTVLEASELSKLLEEKWGVSAAAAPVAMAAGGAAPADDAAAEQDAFTVTLTGFGDNKIGVIKAVRALKNLGLKEAKEFVEGAPKELGNDYSKEDAEAAVAQLKEAGATAELK